MINVHILLKFALYYYLQCLKTMLDAVGLDGKITFYCYIVLYVTRMHCKLMFLLL